MSLEPGQNLLHYRLTEKIGEGGMGVVWKALDTTLDREVALKVLPPLFAADADRIGRLEREAKLLASLNHPNIATVHGLHADGDIRFLTMELVEGEDLLERIRRGPVPQDEAIEIARQIARGLEAAHGAGVIHRDLKPANVRVAAGGQVKVLDFGLARALESASGSSEVSPTLSPTLTSAGTQAGTILGTAAYMSPEQARGHAVDARADVWAFGVVLYEMLSGRPAFKGATVSDTLASVLKVDPDLDAIPPAVQRRLRRLVTRCLQKDREMRFHHIADARILLEEAAAGAPDDASPELVEERRNRKSERALWLAAVVVLAAIVAATSSYFRSDPVERPHRKITLALEGIDPDDPELNEAYISPDGKRVLYVNGERVFVRDLDDWDSREISFARGAGQVFWSDDGTSIGFIRDETLSRISADGSGESVITELDGSTAGAAWGPGGKIFLAGHYSDKTGVFEVPERGGEPRALPFPEELEGHMHDLALLPGDRRFLISVHRQEVMALSVLADGAFTTLLELETRSLPNAVYSSSGHVVYTRGGRNEGIWALPFSADTLEVTGEPFLVAAGGGGPSVSRDGTLIYRRFDFQAGHRLVWVDRKGEILEAIGQPRDVFDYPSLSPDNKKIVVRVETGSESDLWIEDVTRGTHTRLTTEEGEEGDAVWMPDGKRVVYTKRVDDTRVILIRNADGSGEPEKIVDGGLLSVSPDGKYLVFVRWEDGNRDLWYLELGTGGDPVPIVRTEARESRGRVSPDGGYLVYESNESGRYEIYIKRFPSGEGKWLVSLDGGTRPRWSPKGDELFWIDEGSLMVVDVRTEPDLELGTPQKLFSWKPANMLNYDEFDIAADARRFVLVAPVEEPDSPERENTVMLVENWLGE